MERHKRNTTHRDSPLILPTEKGQGHGFFPLFFSKGCMQVQKSVGLKPLNPACYPRHFLAHMLVLFCYVILVLGF